LALVQHNNLPLYDRLASEGISVLQAEQCDASLPVLKIGFFNMMPDAALTATERQFFRLLGSHDNIHCAVYPFRCDELERSPHAQVYLQQHYQPLSEIKHAELDALVVTGANITQSKLDQECFWDQLKTILLWSKSHLKSTLCSCLATHAAMQVYYDVQRRHMGDKCWGVFEHHLTLSDHALLAGVEQSLFMIHSRYNDVSAQDFLTHGIQPLVCSEQAGVQLAAEQDLSVVYFQGHPEYDDISLLKEYKREIGRFINGEIKEYPRFPENYFSLKSQAVLEEYQSHLLTSLEKSKTPPDFPEKWIIPLLDNTWHDTAEAVINNWIGKVYQITDTDRHKPFNQNTDPNNPLNIIK